MTATEENLGGITVGTRLAWTDYTGQACVGVCFETDDSDGAYPWRVIDQNGVKEWIGPHNEPHPVEPPTAWTTERPTEPGLYWVRGGGPAGRLIELDDDLHVSGIGSDMHEHIASGSFDDLEWQRAEPKP